jgi:hypothetical protein
MAETGYGSRLLEVAGERVPLSLTPAIPAV